MGSRLNNIMPYIYSDFSDMYDEWHKIALNLEAKNFLLYGFLRRCSLIKKSIKRVIICTEKLETGCHEESHDELIINLQSCIFNTYGAIDNLAHILNFQLGYGLNRSKIGLGKKNKDFLKKLSKSFKLELEKMDPWFENLNDYRHGLAHRIPLYVPPYFIVEKDRDLFLSIREKYFEAVNNGDINLSRTLDLEMKKIGRFHPVMTHDFRQDHIVVFYIEQVQSDWNTIKKISGLTREEILKHKVNE